VADWATISALATAGGTLVLAGATFAAVRSANRSARVAERTLLAGIRPLLVSSRREDPPQKIYFADQRYVVAPGGGAGVEATDEAIFLGIALRNAGSGIAVLHGWKLLPMEFRQRGHTAPEEFIRLTRDLYLAGGEIGYWQGSFRDPSSPEFAQARRVIDAREAFFIEILYGDEEGGQRRISRFGVAHRDDGQWLAESGRHWNLDRDDPR
jgi:hypothetical protein